MAKQRGIIPVSGRIGQLVFRSGRKGYYVNEHKPGVTKARILSEKNFERTREVMSEFATVAKAAKLLRDSTKQFGDKFSAADSNLRLRTALSKVLKTDLLHPRGFRVVGDGDLSFLTGYEYGKPGAFKNSFNGAYTVNVDRATGDVGIVIGGFVPKQVMNAPVNATHYQFQAGILEVNFETGLQNFKLVQGVKMPWDHIPVPVIHLEGVVTPQTSEPVLALLGIEFWVQENGQYYQINDKGYTSGIIAATTQV